MLNKILLAAILLLMPTACGNAAYKPESKSVSCSDNNGRPTLVVDNIKWAKLHSDKKLLEIQLLDGRSIWKYMTEGEACLLGPAVFPLRRGEQR